MREFETTNENRFDIGLAVKCISAYSLATGMRSMLIDQEGEVLYDACNGKGGCGFCQKAREILGSGQSCKEAHLYGSYQAERFGGRYVYFCPLGLTHWVAPISHKGVMQGAVLGGPVLMMDPEEFLLEDILRKHGVKDDQVHELRQLINEIPIVKPDVVDSLAELLFMVAVHISGESSSQYIMDRESQEQQANISEYIHYIKTMGGDEQSLKTYPIEKERELLSLIAMGDKAGSQRVLNEIFGYIFFSTGGNFEVIKARVLELVVLLSRAALEGGADVEQIFGLNYKFLNEIHNFTSVEDLTYWLSKIMGRFTDCVFNFANVKHADVIYKAVDYIKRNYMRKISLEEVASHVYLSPSYFSKVFKEEMNCNFITYLNQLRINISKKLLLDDSIELVDISNLVGYEDQSYFSKTFKKMTGVTPGKYRECRGQIKNLSSKS